MQFIFGDKGEATDQSALPVTEKERKGEGNMVLGVKEKPQLYSNKKTGGRLKIGVVKQMERYKFV